MEAWGIIAQGSHSQPHLGPPTLGSFGAHVRKDEAPRQACVYHVPPRSLGEKPRRTRAVTAGAESSPSSSRPELSMESFLEPSGPLNHSHPKHAINTRPNLHQGRGSVRWGQGDEHTGA